MATKLISLTVLTTLFVQSLAFDCSSVIKEEGSGVLNWLGNITFTVPVSTGDEGWNMALTFDQEFTGLGVWDVWTENFGDAKWARFWNRDDNARLTQGQIFSFRFRVNYGRDFPKPIAVSLKFFDYELCK